VSETCVLMSVFVCMCDCVYTWLRVRPCMLCVYLAASETVHAVCIPGCE